MKFNIDLYNDAFFEWHSKYVHDDCVRAGWMLAKRLDINSVVDYGCGIGSFLQGVHKFNPGIKIQGYEISTYADKYIHPDMTEFIQTGTDIFNNKSDVSDLSICLEVAEHIEPKNSKRLVEILCNNTDKYIVFSAAPKEQGGTGHINCHNKNYWVRLFNANVWIYDTMVTEMVLKTWHFLPDYYLNNIMVFTK